MDFDSIEQLEAHVLGIMDNCAILGAQKMLEIMIDEITKAYNQYSPNMYDRTYDLIHSPQMVSANRLGMETEFMDNGGWYSLVGKTAGQHFFALAGLESGSTWGREGTNIVPFATVKCYSNVPDYYIQCMKKFGVPII